MNTVCLIGRLVADPEMKYTPSGVAVATTRIAVNRSQKGDDGKMIADFFDLTLWNKAAEFASQYLGKGRLVAVHGSLQQNNWTDQSGVKRNTVKITANEIQGLDRPKGQQQPVDSDPGDWV